MNHSLLATFSLSLFLMLALAEAQPESTAESACSSSFHLLEADLLSRPHNRYNLTAAFFPPRDANPVVVKVYYKYEGSNATNVWFWSESEFYFIQPLDIFLYTSLFFANQPYRMGSITLELSTDCLDADKLQMRVLTQRVSTSLYHKQCTCACGIFKSYGDYHPYSLVSMPSQLLPHQLLVLRVSVMATLLLLQAGWRFRTMLSSLTLLKRGYTLYWCCFHY